MTGMRLAVWVVATLILTGSASPQQLITTFRLSGEQSEYGIVSEVEFATSLVELESGSLAHHVPQAMKDLRFDERVWVIRYRTNI